MLQTSECVHNLHKLMLDLSNQYSDSETTLFVNGLLSDDTKQVGLLLNERYVNIPPPISVPLFHAIRYYYIDLINKNNILSFLYFIIYLLSQKTFRYFSVILLQRPGNTDSVNVSYVPYDIKIQ